MNKKYLVFGLMGLFIMAFATAAIVQYYGQTQVDMEIESPVVMYGDLTTVNVIAGDGYRLYLVEGENLLNRDVDVKFQFTLLKDGETLEDTSGFYLAYSSDIDYAYKEEYGAAQDWDQAQTWMDENLDWFDWYLTGALVDYDATVITNHGENSVVENALPFNVEFGEDLSPGKFYAVVYLDVDEAVVPGSYTLSVDMTPVVA